jgi:hypothetical protein
LIRAGRLWTLTTVAHSLPFVAAAGLLVVLKPITAPISLILVIHAWAIPELYASRGAKALRRRTLVDTPAERTSVGLLADLLDHRRHALLAETGLALERGKLGAWLVAENGAVLVRPGAGRVNCYCVKAVDPDLPAGDRIAHLLLALRTDESGFATVSNLVFSGARWRLRRRLQPPGRTALEAAAVAVTQ